MSMVCVSGLKSLNHHIWYQLGSMTCLVHIVVNCLHSFCRLVCQVGLSHWRRCTGVSLCGLHIGHSRSISLVGLFPGDT